MESNIETHIDNYLEFTKDLNKLTQFLRLKHYTKGLITNTHTKNPIVKLTVDIEYPTKEQTLEFSIPCKNIANEQMRNLTLESILFHILHRNTGELIHL